MCLFVFIYIYIGPLSDWGFDANINTNNNSNNNNAPELLHFSFFLIQEFSLLNPKLFSLEDIFIFYLIKFFKA